MYLRSELWGGDIFCPISASSVNWFPHVGVGASSSLSYLCNRRNVWSKNIQDHKNLQYKGFVYYLMGIRPAVSGSASSVLLSNPAASGWSKSVEQRSTRQNTIQSWNIFNLLSGQLNPRLVTKVFCFIFQTIWSNIAEILIQKRLYINDAVLNDDPLSTQKMKAIYLVTWKWRRWAAAAKYLGMKKIW